jgi:RNA 3'-terminal phosphate cyclase (ATP)
MTDNDPAGTTLLEINGAYGEGGGQIIRSALALSMLLDQPVRLVNIRAGRKRPGLQPQHLTAVRAAAALSQATIAGAELGSLTLTFQPQAQQSGPFRFEVGTAGAVTLIWQALLPPLIWGSEPIQLTLCGGTHVPWSPAFHYLEQVFLPMVYPLGIQASLTLQRAGWYPQGGGEIRSTIGPIGGSALRSHSLTQRGALQRVTVYALSSNLPAHIAQREGLQARQRVQAALGITPEVKLCDLPAIGQGTMVLLVAEFEQTRVGFSAMGKRGKRAEQVSDEAVDQFLAFYQTHAAVDGHLADQLLLYFAIASGTSQLLTHHLSEHVLTQIWLIEQFLPVRFHVEGELGQPARITVTGCGYRGNGTVGWW